MDIIFNSRRNLNDKINLHIKTKNVTKNINELFDTLIQGCENLKKK